MKYKILLSIAVFAWPIAYAMESEVNQFIPFESDQIKIINDLFEQIKDWERPVLQHYEPDVLPESKEKFYTQESKITLSISDESTLGFEKKFCQLCSKWVLNIKRHAQQVHTKEKPYKCNLCNNAFLYPCDLREHLEKHENNHIKSRPFKCTICNKAAYSAQKRLDNHMNTIHGEKGFICRWCNKTFDKKFALEAHERTHTGERPFPCTLCDDSFAQNGNLKRHLRTQHPDSDR